MLEFRSINIQRDLEQLQTAWDCLDEIVHAVRQDEYPEYIESDICDILERYGIDYSKIKED